jgi:hypothetical protein
MVAMKNKGASILLLAALLLPVAWSGCASSVDEPETGNLTAEVTTAFYDEFHRVIAPSVTVHITLTAKDRVLFNTIPPESTTCHFSGLPFQIYVATAEADGFYPYSKDLYIYLKPGMLTANCEMYPQPSPSLRIDSLQNIVNSIVPQIRVRLVCPQPLPVGGARKAAIIVGLTAKVSPRRGDYVYALESTPGVEGSAVLWTEDFYRELHQAGVVTGTTVFVTARLETGATSVSADPGTGVLIFSALEQNSYVLAPLIMP